MTRLLGDRWDLLSKFVCTTIPLLSLFVTVDARATSYALSVDGNGLPQIEADGGAALRTTFGLWGTNWSWAGFAQKFQVTGPYAYHISATSPSLGIGLETEIKKGPGQSLIYHFDWSASRESVNLPGGGLVFRFDLTGFSAELGEPELLPNNTGWTWGKPGGPRFEMRFEPAIAAVYFERGHRDEIRAFFYSQTIPQGHKEVTAIVSAGGPDAAVVPSIGERYGLLDVGEWHTDKIDADGAPVDLSFLNEKEIPAGKHGFVQARGAHLGFEDGTPVRFWGTNVTAYALFGTSKNEVCAQAKRISQLGFNLVRLHHHDSNWVSPNIFGARGASTNSLDPVALDKLDWWIQCLKREGIYVWLDLHVGRHFQAGDHIDAYDELARGKSDADLKGFNYVNESIETAMRRFDEQIVTHLNSYTHLRYKDDPAIAAMLITNENDVTHHFGNLLLPDKGVPIHSAWFQNDAEQFAKRVGISKDRFLRTWEPGPAKLFLNDLEHGFDARMISYLRELGVKVPIATTSLWGDDPAFALPALQTGDLIDVHAYARPNQLDRNPLRTAALVDSIAAGHLVGQPLSVSEWNADTVSEPDRHVLPLLVAATASHQGWDALMQFAYGQNALDSAGAPGDWTVYNDPAYLSTLPAAALLYRQGQVREATTTYVEVLSEDDFFGQAIGPWNDVALRTAVERGKFLVALPHAKALPWLKPQEIPKGAHLLTRSSESVIDAKQSEVISDTSELRHNWANGTFLIDTPRTQAGLGWLGNRGLHLRDVDLELTSKSATVVVQSLDDVPIRESRHIMISFGTPTVPRMPNKLPFVSAPIGGMLSVAAPEGLRAYGKSGEDWQVKELHVEFSSGRYQIHLNDCPSCSWIFLR